MSLFLSRPSRSQEAGLPARVLSPSPTPEPAFCRSELARDPQRGNVAQAAVACKQAPTLSESGRIQFLEAHITRRAGLKISTLLGLAPALFASALTAADTCTSWEQALLVELEVSIVLEAGLAAAASAAPDASDVRDVASTGGDAPSETHALLGLGCLDDVLDRVVDGEAAALELIAYFEPDAAARHTLQRFLDGSDVHQRPALLPVLTRLGSSTVDAILSAAECIDDCRPHDNFLFAFVLETLGSERRRAALPLAQKLGPHSRASEEELGLMRMLEALGEDIAPAEAVLLTLFHSTPGLKDRLLGLLVQAGSAEAIALLEVELRAPWPGTVEFAHAAIAGQRARALTPVLLEVAASSTPEANRAALLALGHVAGPEDAAMVQAVLHPWMRDGSHPIRALFAAMALGEMASHASEGVLLEAADAYWYPPVRAAAQEALDRMRNASDPDARIDVQRFFDRVWALPGPVECEATALRIVDQAQGEKLYKRTHAVQLQKLSYRGDLVEEYLPPPPPPPPGASTDWRPSPQPVEVPEHTPDLALRVAGGWLLGANRGEWGGELIFAADDGHRQGVLGRNVEDIYRLGPHLIALVGLAHLGSNDGAAYRLQQGGDGQWSAKPWLQLPGAPMSSWPVETGEILVNTYGGGTILIAANGQMRMAPCLDPPALEFLEQP